VPIAELKAFSPANSSYGAFGDSAGVVSLVPGGAAGTGSSIVSLEEADRQHILRALRQTEWRIAGPRGAANLLGMKRTTLQARMRKLGIKRPV
jgi:transcriptional regulator with GAF, ATPase, and Fis domain